MAVDFFVSYTAADRAWAEWIAFELEEAGFSTTIQAWDFRPGNNFVQAMQETAAAARRTAMVLSPAYLRSQFAAPEWAAAFSADPRGIAAKLVPVRIEPCDAPGLLRSIVHIDLVGLGEKEARDALLQGIDGKRAKPSKPPSFPGVARATAAKAFPGPAATDAPSRRTHLPKVTRPANDVDKRQLLRRTMEATRDHFVDAMRRLASEADGVTTDLEEVSAREFFAEIFVDGKSRARCRIWQGGLHSEHAISYAEGGTAAMAGASNEILSIRTDGGEVFMRSLMGAAAFGMSTEDLDLQRLAPEDTAEYLWRRFTSRLG